MQNNLLAPVLICTLLASTTCSLARSAPVSDAPSALDTNPSTENSQSDIIRNEAEYQRAPRQFEQQAANSIRDPRNYVHDDVSIEAILRMFGDEPEEEPQETAESTQESGFSPAPSEETTTDTTTTTTTTTSFPVITSDAEFEEVLARLRQEALGQVFHPMNYVNDDSEVEKLTEQIDALSTETLLDRWNNGSPLITEPLDECPICREEMEESAVQQLHPCSHKFHKACIMGWAGHRNCNYNHVPCPCCRELGSFYPIRGNSRAQMRHHSNPVSTSTETPHDFSRDF